MNAKREPLGRLWTERAGFLTENGTVRNFRVRIIRKRLMLWSESGEYFNPSAMPVRCFMERALQIILSQKFNSEGMFLDEDVRANDFSIHSIIYRLSRMWQCLSYLCSVKKRGEINYCI